jgi:hypothetical protein
MAVRRGHDKRTDLLLVAVCLARVHFGDAHRRDLAAGAVARGNAARATRRNQLRRRGHAERDAKERREVKMKTVYRISGKSRGRLLIGR